MADYDERKRQDVYFMALDYAERYGSSQDQKSELFESYCRAECNEWRERFGIEIGATLTLDAYINGREP
jgi:hypothetical protein